MPVVHLQSVANSTLSTDRAIGSNEKNGYCQWSGGMACKGVPFIMKKKTVLASILSLTLAAGITASAWAEIFQKTIIMSPGAGDLVIEDLGVGDTLVLTLVNPSSQPLIFETTQRIGDEARWSVPPNSQITVQFPYTRPFDDDVEFVVRGTEPGAPVVTRGMLIPSQAGEVPVAQPVTPRPAVMPGEMPAAMPVRGYW
jgi:hypothetical protein